MDTNNTKKMPNKDTGNTKFNFEIYFLPESGDLLVVPEGYFRRGLGV